MADQVFEQRKHEATGKMELEALRIHQQERHGGRFRSCGMGDCRVRRSFIENTRPEPMAPCDLYSNPFTSPCSIDRIRDDVADAARHGDPVLAVCGRHDLEEIVGMWSSEHHGSGPTMELLRRTERVMLPEVRHGG